MTATAVHREYVVGTVAVVIVIGAIIFAVILGILYALRRTPPRAPEPGRQKRLPAPLAEFHVAGEEARVSFDVPLATGEIDPVLAEVLIREAVEVVREKRHHLPISEVHRVVAFGRRDGEWVRVGAVDLETPGELPPPAIPEFIPRQAGGFDPFETLDDLPRHAPGLAATRKGEELPPLHEDLRLPSNVEAGLRSQGIDPATAGAGDLVLGIMRLTGYQIDRSGEDTFSAARAGETAFVRLVPHRPGDHPELSEREVRRFAVAFVEAKADRGLLVTEKYSPFEIYDRERRDPRMRFVTRERLQHFVDALALR
jgi:hypothetical protein